MATPELVDNYAELLLSNTPLLDVRAPVEFAQGSFPGAVNLPLMNDAEREAVGIAYKQQGQDAAVRLGHKLVSGSVRHERIAQWAAFMQRHPDGVLYCFRGGMRSQISQQWLKEAGHDRPRVAGGYKAMRQFLLQSLDRSIQNSNFVVVGGLTGSGKTDVIQALDAKIDLEGLACHRGSSFGGRAQRQPSQIDFENSLSIELLRLTTQAQENIAVEDESHLIGRCAVPLKLRQKTQQSSLVWVTAPLQERVKRIQRDYIESLARDYIEEYGQADGLDRYQSHLTKSLHNLRNRLGLERYAKLQKHLESALVKQLSHGEFEAHRAWIEPLMTDYYDPMYEYQRQQKKSSVVFEGTANEVIAYLKANGH
ncbi:MAG: tRNA 2-selenouridine(34) synthase MnmH [Burkholderiaceae bacterium]|nr:tRNA 2-selenouridine(34) synthase MnmH [Burkholderiaceae bacterium]MCD8515750.1 tRNA 2-selenouridine(34) synthase MnmH [Burkholderiaceae bacterium]MCD8564914.1 tRNA 2-selenouridine(34) synthase MnmH [Burkholderiaceae bacterium]